MIDSTLLCVWECRTSWSDVAVRYSMWYWWCLWAVEETRDCRTAVDGWRATYWHRLWTLVHGRRHHRCCCCCCWRWWWNELSCVINIRTIRQHSFDVKVTWCSVLNDVWIVWRRNVVSWHCQAICVFIMSGELPRCQLLANIYTSVH